MGKLDTLVADHIERRLLQPARLEEILSSVLDRRDERAERRSAHITAGDVGRAHAIMLDVEQPLYEATTLLILSGRRSRPKRADPISRSPRRWQSL